MSFASTSPFILTPAIITARRPFEEINDAFDDLRAQRGVRTLITFD